MARIRRTNKSGYPGLRQLTNSKWVATAAIPGSPKTYLGTFATRDAAIDKIVEFRLANGLPLYQESPRYEVDALTGHGLIPLSNGELALVDGRFVEDVGKHWWSLRCIDGYPNANVDGQTLRLHNFIGSLCGMEAEYIDHKDGDKLNNLASNLRACTRAENMQNSRMKRNNRSGLKGAHWCEDKGHWKSSIMVNREHIRLGTFDTAEEAHAAYCQASKKYHGAFGRTE